LSLLNSTDVPSMTASRCWETVDAVIEGAVETLTTSRELVLGMMPNVRKEVAI